MKHLAFVNCLILFCLCSCHSGLKPNVGYVCKTCDNNLVTLDGDTFRLQETITPDLLIVSNYPEWDDRSYLMKKAQTGYYYMVIGSDELSSIDNTTLLVSVDGNEVYNIETGSQYKLPCRTTNLTYLGEWNDMQAFTTGDTICYSDGKCIALNEDSYCRLGKTPQNVTLASGARTLTTTLGDIYDFKKGRDTAPLASKRVVKELFIKPQNKYESGGIGFSVDLDIPEGESMSDVAIRAWMIDAIKNDAFSLLGHQNEFQTIRKPSYDKFMNTLDEYGVLWEKLCRNDYQDEDTLMVNLNGEIRTRMIVDTPNYVTYYYWASLYSGGLHDMPRSYYITYDKNRQTMLSAANTIKPSKLVQFRKDVMNALKDRHDDIYEDKGSMEDFMQQAFSFHSPINDEDMDEKWKTFLVHEYECDEWSGWETAIKEEFSLDNFPLPHFALLPEGIVVSYHPYQIDCFNAGEYHAIVPYSKANPCLSYNYHEVTDKLPKLDDYLAYKTK